MSLFDGVPPPAPRPPLPPPPRRRATLGTLTDADLDVFPAWVITHYEPEDWPVEAVMLDASGAIPFARGDVLCLCRARFADGSEHRASAMCRSDAPDGPRAWSFSNGHAEVTLIMPESGAPALVLEKEGPERFAEAFGRRLEEIFPLVLEVVPKFQMPPRRRGVIIEMSGALTFFSDP